MSKTEFSDRHNMFQTFCRPGLTELLTSVGLDKIYKRGEGDYLYYDNEQGQEIQVLDFLGGYGANLFGHNHPRLNRTAQEMFHCAPQNC
jgi:acetylornithine/succinyldiaminopimelate/putrescine aminotransferase